MLPSPYRSKPLQSRPRRAIFKLHRLRVFACLMGLAAVATCVARGQQQPQPTQEAGSTSQPRPWAESVPAVASAPDANAQMEMRQQQSQSKQAKLDAANAARRKQIADDTARLLQLAKDLKADVDKTDKDTLSLEVIRKAESIERLAKGVKEKMKLTAGAG